MNIGKIMHIAVTNDTAYLAGVIIGDGNISAAKKSKTDPSKDYRIVLDISDREYVRYISAMIKGIITTKSRPKDTIVKKGRKARMTFVFRNKSFYYFLTEVMGIPQGKKSDLVRVPVIIQNADGEIKKHFLAGLFDTDGGFRGKTLGFTTASKVLWEGISDILTETNMRHQKENWINKKYDKMFYGIRISVKEIDRFLKIFPLQNIEKLNRIREKFYAELPERSNGPVSLK